ncbi:hypothetical protein DVH24_010348 [Malus domestica]|uniref:Uncharacterized protein n=1 Tax=Malus domestica TaxID=3750 RepID=A0A498JVN8_MALDO|nr:hypothetical protein DVH24_010348 [Malus domestica]
MNRWTWEVQKFLDECYEYWPPAALCLHIRTLQPLIWVNHGIGYITTHIPRCYYKYIPVKSFNNLNSMYLPFT